RAGAGAEHAGRAVVLAQGDHAPGPQRRRFLLVRGLHGGRTVGDGLAERLQGDAETLDQSRGLGHQNATFRIAVSMMLARASGTRPFQANRCSWSSRRRGNVKRTHMMIAASSVIFASM